MRFVVTGTGRSGTRWAADVLGVGHQAMFTGDGYLHQEEARGDVSFWAASQILENDNNMTDFRDWRVVLLVRDPRLVVASWLASGEFEGMLGNGHYRMWQHCKKIDPYITRLKLSTQERVEAYWAAVNMHVADRADVVLRLEDTDESDLCAAVGVPAPDDGVDPGPLDREPVTLQDEYAISVAREFGYDC